MSVPGNGGKKPGRCKFCRSKAKYLPGQRSFDAAGIFGRRHEQREPRRALSEDQPGLTITFFLPTHSKFQINLVSILKAVCADSKPQFDPEGS